MWHVACTCKEGAMGCCPHHRGAHPSALPATRPPRIQCTRVGLQACLFTCTRLTSLTDGAQACMPPQRGSVLPVPLPPPHTHTPTHPPLVPRVALRPSVLHHSGSDPLAGRQGRRGCASRETQAKDCGCRLACPPSSPRTHLLPAWRGDGSGAGTPGRVSAWLMRHGWPPGQGWVLGPRCGEAVS